VTWHLLDYFRLFLAQQKVGIYVHIFENTLQPKKFYKKSSNFEKKEIFHSLSEKMHKVPWNGYIEIKSEREYLNKNADRDNNLSDSENFSNSRKVFCFCTNPNLE